MINNRIKTYSQGLSYYKKSVKSDKSRSRGTRWSICKVLNPTWITKYTEKSQSSQWLNWTRNQYLSWLLAILIMFDFDAAKMYSNDVPILSQQ